MRLLVVDACRSGTITRVKGMQPSESFDLQLLDGGGGSSPAEGLGHPDPAQPASRARSRIVCAARSSPITC